MTSILPLVVRDACVNKRGHSIIGPINLEIDRVGLTVVLGPNGAGKTTLLRTMHGLERLSSGRVDWQLPRAEAEQRQAYVFQTPIVMRRSVVDNIAYPLIVRGDGRGPAHTAAASWADKVGLGDALQRPARELSGGEKQKLSLARALIVEPDILFLDEPTVNLDGRATREIEQTLATASSNGTRIVLATHDLGQARRLATDVIFMYRGSVLERADAPTFFTGPEAPEARAFLNGEIVD